MSYFACVKYRPIITHSHAICAEICELVYIKLSQVFLQPMGKDAAQNITRKQSLEYISVPSDGMFSHWLPLSSNTFSLTLTFHFDRVFYDDMN